MGRCGDAAGRGAAVSWWQVHRACSKRYAMSDQAPGDAAPQAADSQADQILRAVHRDTGIRVVAALTSGVCRRGVISCSHPLTPVCVDAGPMAAGTTCGERSVCNSAGDCVPCNEGATCSTGIGPPKWCAGYPTYTSISRFDSTASRS